MHCEHNTLSENPDCVRTIFFKQKVACAKFRSTRIWISSLEISGRDLLPCNTIHRPKIQGTV